MPERLTALDGSFLRVESATAHMHVAWCALLEPAEGRPAPDIDALRLSVEGRLQHTPRFRRRLRSALPGMGEPFWVDDPDFDIDRHVTLLCDPVDRPDERRFHALTDRALSEPLDRERPLWKIYLAPKLADGSAGMIAKIHHALVDGRSAVEVAMLLFDVTPDADPAPAADWRPEPERGAARLSLSAIGGGASETLRAARGVARMAGHPISGGTRIYETARRAALTVGEDLLRPAPASYLNVPISPRRTLVYHRARLEHVLAVKQAARVTLNDVCLAIVSGGLRETALARGATPRTLKAMVPVSMRTDDQRTDLGNRISLAFVDLPVQLSTAGARLARVHAATSAFKESDRPAGAETVFDGLGLLPDALRTTAAKAVGSKRVYNLTVSNIPGPRFDLFVLGARLREAYPVVPLADSHALSIGIFSYGEHLHFGLYADPEALPDVTALPAAFSAALLALRRSAGGGSRRYADTLLATG